MNGDKYMHISNEILDELLSNYSKPEDLVGQEGILNVTCQRRGRMAKSTAFPRLRRLCLYHSCN